MDFLKSLPPHALVADCGCGNGKYLGELPALQTFGSDTSMRLLQLCRER
jgi:SAM-dependent methyltransferase